MTVHEVGDRVSFGVLIVCALLEIAIFGFGHWVEKYSAYARHLAEMRAELEAQKRSKSRHVQTRSF